VPQPIPLFSNRALVAVSSLLVVVFVSFWQAEKMKIKIPAESNHFIKEKLSDDFMVVGFEFKK
jgi:hypothetical protein